MYAELLFYEEKFAPAKICFEKVLANPHSNNSDKVAAYLGITDCSLMLWTVGRTENERIAFFNQYPKKALLLAGKTSFREYALKYCALFLSSSTQTNAQAISYYEQFIKEFPKSRYIEEMLLRLGLSYAQEKNYKKAEEMLKMLKNEDFKKILIRSIKFKKGELKK